MTFRIRHLQLRSITGDGPYGADIKFGSGLTVLWADNTQGKSTCMQAMLYALGLEKMLSPKRDIPLPHAMTRYLNTDAGTSHNVLESYVALELENAAGHVITVRRSVKALTDPRLITVDLGGTLSDPRVKVARRSYFVSDPGSATRPEGFHHFLEDYLDWSLPSVRRYDMPESKLYLETVFPLFWVEQKAGWSAVPAAIPTYFRIREVQKRAVEFLLDLDAHRMEVRRQQISDQILALSRTWRALWEEIDVSARLRGARTEALPTVPVANLDGLVRAHLQVADPSGWIDLGTYLTEIRGRIAKLSDAATPTASESAPENSLELARVTSEIDKLNASRVASYRRRQIKLTDITSVEGRIRSLRDDLQKNQDVQKLERYSGAKIDLAPDRCPTCEQSLVDTLLSQNVVESVMPIGDNIDYLKSQIRMFADILDREKASLKEAVDEIAVSDQQLGELFARARSLRADLIAPGTAPSAAAIEQRVRAEARVSELVEIQSLFDSAIEKFKELAEGHTRLLDELAGLPGDGLTASDREKIAVLSDLLRRQAESYSFSTFQPEDLSISEDTYKPQKEGFEIGFEISASDAIRLKWAYQIGLLELSSQKTTNHPGVLLFDEPRQQETAKVSFKALLERASRAKARNQQIVFSTSEDLDSLRAITDSLDCDLTVFDGYVIQKLAN